MSAARYSSQSETLVLRAYDSIHLAAAEAAAGVASGRTAFAFSAFDARLTRAAQACGLPLLGPLLDAPGAGQ
jgi:hypothetical protein